MIPDTFIFKLEQGIVYLMTILNLNCQLGFRRKLLSLAVIINVQRALGDTQAVLFGDKHHHLKGSSTLKTLYTLGCLHWQAPLVGHQNKYSPSFPGKECKSQSQQHGWVMAALRPQPGAHILDAIYCPGSLFCFQRCPWQWKAKIIWMLSLKRDLGICVGKKGICVECNIMGDIYSHLFRL